MELLKNLYATKLDNEVPTVREYDFHPSIRVRVTPDQGRAETFGGAGAQNIKGAHETRL